MIGQPLVEKLAETLVYLSGARLAPPVWDDLYPVLQRLETGVRAGASAEVGTALREVDRLRPSRVAALPEEGGQKDHRPHGAPVPVPEHINKLIHGIEHSIAPHAGDEPVAPQEG